MPVLRQAFPVSSNFMKTTVRYIVIFILTTLLFINVKAQDTATIDFYKQIKNYNFSTIFAPEAILVEGRNDNKSKIQRAEVLGFIGDSYQRFLIHFVSITQNPKNHYEYLAYGKTMVKEKISSFKGTITVKQSKIYKSGDLPEFKQGFVTCDLILYEDKKQTSTGFIKGKLTSSFIIDNKGKIRYDALMFAADGFSNNEFVGNWTSYKMNISKKCNWGDYRIPESGDLDIGAGEFSVNEKYIKNGWLSYMLKNMSPNLAIKREKSRVKIKNWWE